MKKNNKKELSIYLQRKLLGSIDLSDFVEKGKNENESE